MAQYFNGDFADFPASWIERFNPPATGAFAVSGGNLVLPNGKSGDWATRSWAAIEGDVDRDQVEVLLLVQQAASAGDSYMLQLRASGADEAATQYVLQLNSVAGRLRWNKCAGADAPSTVGPASSDKGAIAAGEQFWLRARVNGRTPSAVLLQAKLWRVADAEPGAWDISTSDATSPIYTAGWVGVGGFGVAAANAHTILQIGVGTNGDAAPSSAPTPLDITGNIQLDDAAPSGLINSNPPATLSGTVQTGDAVASGSISTGGAPGTVLLAAWKNLSGMPLPSTPVARITLQRLSDGVQVLNLAGLTTSSDALNPSITITNAALAPGVDYLAIANNADGSQLGVELARAT